MLNKYILLLGLLVFATAFISTSVLADPPKGYTFLTYDQGLKKAKKSGKKIFLYYGRQGCGYCDKTNKEAFSIADVKKAITENFILVYVDAEGGRRMTLPTGERITEMQLGMRLNAIGTPVFMVLHSNGKKIVNVPGFQTAGDFIALTQYVNNEHYKTKSLAQYEASLQ